MNFKWIKYIVGHSYGVYVGMKCIQRKPDNFAKLSEFYRMVKPLEGEKVIHKEYPSSFLRTDLHEYLQEKGIKKLVVAGMMSHMCVDTTVRACQDYGYEVIVIEDACTTKG